MLPRVPPAIHIPPFRLHRPPHLRISPPIPRIPVPVQANLVHALTSPWSAEAMLPQVPRLVPHLPNETAPSY